MKSSLTLGRVSGIGIFIHWTFVILIAWIVIVNLREGVDTPSILWSVAFVLSIFVCVILHELGHALTAKRFGISTKSITLYPIGGLARLEKFPKDPKQELWIALAGPAVNIVIAGALFPFVNLTSLEQTKTAITINESNFLLLFATVNLWLALFNLLPAFPMDGGRVFRALLAFRMPRYKATRIAAAVGQFLAIGFVFLGFYVNPFLIFIGLFVFIGAQAETQHSQTQELAEGHLVGGITIHDFPRLSPDNTIEDAVNIILDSQNKNFVIEENGSKVGTLSQHNLIRGLRQKGDKVSVREIMDTDILNLQADTPVDEALTEMQSKGKNMAFVYSGNEFKGMVDTDNLVEFIMVQAARKRFEASN